MKTDHLFFPKSFRYQEEEGVATITLDRPDTLNSLTFEVYEELTETFAKLQDHHGVDAVVITGTGRGFCSGGDVNEIIGALFARDARGLTEFTRLTGQLVVNIRTLRKPVIAALNGTTAGAGAVIALASDFRIAVPAAKIAFLFTKVGLTGADMGAAFLLPKVIGLARATELLMLGDAVTADVALAMGLVSKVVAPESLISEARALAARLASGPAFALGVTKDLLNHELAMGLHAAIEWEAQAQALCMQAPEFREAYESFTQKRAPDFRRVRERAR
ncbi:MAG: enoyl-CoA hydratase family protein [Acidobacteriota bacterium]